MNVLLIAQTKVEWADVDPLMSRNWHAKEWTDDADYLAEFAGRDCYQSHDRPNVNTADNKDYLANILGQRHYSVLEHGSATFRITGVSRSFTHELIRHRHLSYSQLSQRFVDSKSAELIVPPLIAEWPNETDRAMMLEEMSEAWRECLAVYDLIEQTLYEGMEKHFPEYSGTMRRKRAREAARAIMPNATATLIDVTGNHRAWREFLDKRIGAAADLEINAVAKEILRQLLTIAPNIYQDMAEWLIEEK